MDVKRPSYREGTCFKCGRALGFYDSKFIEREEPARVMCAFSPDHNLSGCPAPLKAGTGDEQWFYYTDG